MANKTADGSKALNTLSSANIKVPSSEDIKGNMRLLQQLYSHFTKVTCRSCRANLSIQVARKHLRQWLPSAKGSQPAQLSGILCQKCQKWTCIGCRGKTTLASKTISTPAAAINHCCDQGRLFGIYILLSRFDEVEFTLQSKAAGAPGRRKPSRADKGTGYAEDSGSNYGSDYSLTSRNLNWHDTSKRPHQQDNETDDLFTQMMQLLSAFIPITSSESKFDKSPPAHLFSLFRMSLLIDRLAALVRNDSVEDMGKRNKLYDAVLEFIIAVAKHPVLVNLLTEKRPDKKKSPGLQYLGDTIKKPAFDFDGSTAGMRASLITTGLATLKQAKNFTDLSKNAILASDLRTAEGDKTVAICKRLIDFYKTIDKTAPDASRRLNLTAKDAWDTFKEKNRVTFSDAVLDRHYLYTQFSSVTRSRSGRMAKLMKEIASLTTSLPSGIFLKFSERRPDVLKALIIGVGGTPYEGGLFAFDIFLPEDWPVDPPIVYFVIEGYESVRDGINPNIHADGKVCLSLLNTWIATTPEEKWQPNRSTLLSVFVSIQAMILGSPEPLSNEPGYGHQSSSLSDEARIYKKHVECHVVHFAILYWLSSRAAEQSVWHGLAQQYYKHKKNKVLARVKYLASRNGEVIALAREIEKHLAGGSSRGSSATFSKGNQ